MNNAVTILKYARSLIADCGWTRKRYGNRLDGFCMYGALKEAYDTHGISPFFDTANFLRSALPAHCFDILTYNDVMAQSRDEVLNVFDAAIALAEGSTSVAEQERSGSSS